MAKTQSIVVTAYFILGLALLGTASLVINLGVRGWLAMVLILAWTLAPYIALGYTLKKRSTSTRKAALNCLMVLLVSLGGLYMLIDIIFIHPDPQGAIALLFVPILQFVGIGILSGLFSWMTRLITAK